LRFQAPLPLPRFLSLRLSLTRASLSPGLLERRDAVGAAGSQRSPISAVARVED
jgi:hypothetical protein